MTRPKKRKTDDKITEPITPDFSMSKKPRGRNLLIQMPATQSDKPSSPVVSSPASYQVMPAVCSRISRNTPMITPI